MKQRPCRRGTKTDVKPALRRAPIIPQELSQSGYSPPKWETYAYWEAHSLMRAFSAGVRRRFDAMYCMTSASGPFS